MLERRQLQFPTRYELASKIDSAKSLSEIFYAAEWEKCIENQKSWRQKPKWKNVSTAVQGFPQRSLHHSFCEKWPPPEWLFHKSEKGCRFREKCPHALRQVDEQPSKRSKKNGDKSAVAMLKITRQLGCVFQDMEPPKSSSILRKSSNTRKPIRCVRFTKAVVRHANIRV